MKVRLTKAVKVRRRLGYGDAVQSYGPGDLEVGPDIPEGVASDLIERGIAKRIRAKGERETKRARLA